MNFFKVFFLHKAWAFFHLLIFIFFSAGIVCGKFFPFVLVYFILLVAISGFLIVDACFNDLLKNHDFIIIFLIGIFFLGSLAFARHSMDESRLIFNQKVNVVFKVLSYPKENKSNNMLKVFVSEISGQRAGHEFAVFDYSRKLKYLGIYEGEVVLKKRFFHGRVFRSFWIKKNDIFVKSNMSFVDRCRMRITEYGIDFFKGNFSKDAGVFFIAVILGRRESLGRIRTDFGYAGLAHLLAISGLHVGVITGIIFFILRLFNLSLDRTLWITSVFLGAYVVLTGLSPSTVRAFIMWVVFFFTFILKRKGSVFNSLGLAGFIMALIDPGIIFQIGFQLSFVSVFSLLIAFNLSYARRCRPGILWYIKSLFLVSLWVNIGILPIISLYFKNVYVLSVIYNIVFVPWFSLTLILGVLSVFFMPLRILAGLCADMLCNAVHYVGGWPGTYIVYGFNFFQVILYYIILTIIVSFAIYSNKQDVYKKN